MHFGGVKAVNGVDLQIRQGEIYSIIGPNGAGKTTVFNCLTGFYAPTAGEIQFNGRSIAGLAPYRVTRLGMARTFQNVRLFGEMSALENVMSGRCCRTRSGVLASLLSLGRSRREDREAAQRAMDELAFVGLAGQAETWARNLAYGDQRRLEIARALATQPQLLLLDEPGAGMNPSEIGRTTELIERIRSRGITVVLIEHHMKLVMSISHRITVLDHGEPLCHGTPSEICQSSQVVEAYLGKRYEDSE
jgi:branched-chain amino acid transport system ATP-binding protein